MNNNPLEIIIEFLNSETPQLRRNAMTALANLHDSEAVKYMVQTALTDKDESVRARAEDELANLDEQSLTMLSKDFITRLGDKSESLPAYALLGRLRSRGLQLKLESLNWLRTLYLEFGLFKYVYPKRGWAFYFRSFMPAIKAGLMASVVYIIFFALLHYRINVLLPKKFSLSLLETNVELNDLIYAGIGMTLLIPLITFRTLALDLYADKYKGALIESIWAALAGLLLGITVSGGFGIALMFAMVAVRMGCISTHGVEVDYFPKHFVQTLSGAIAGTLVLFTFAWLDFNEDTGKSWNFEECTYYLVVFFQAANSYATIDIAHAKALPRNTTLLPRLFAYGLPVLFAIIVGAAFLPETRCTVTGEDIQASPNVKESLAMDVSQAPYCQNLVVGADQQVDITIPAEEAIRYGLRVFKETKLAEYDDVSTVGLPVEAAPDQASTSEVPPNSSNKITLSKPGKYLLIFSRKDSGLLHKQINIKNALLILLDHYSGLLRHGKNAIPPVKMDIAFTNISRK